MEIPEVTQTEEGQKQKLKIVLDEANRILQIQSWQQPKWTVESKTSFPFRSIMLKPSAHHVSLERWSK